MRRRGWLAAPLLMAGWAVTTGPAHAATTCQVGIAGGYTTVQSAVDDANCATVSVNAGIYPEHVVVHRAVIVQGGSASTSVITGGLEIGAGADSTSIYNLQLTGAPGVVGNGIDITASVSNVTFNSVAAQFNGGNGLAIDAGTVSNLSILSSNFNDNAGDGLYVAAAATVNGLSVLGGTFDRNGTGIDMLGSVTASSISGALLRNDGRGLYAEQVSTSTFDHLTVDQSATTGIAFNLQHGSFSGVQITNTKVASSGADGVSLAAASDATVSGFLANFDSVHDNVGYGVRNATPATMDGVCNWWGSSTGPSGSGSGLGDEVSAGVKYQPWLSAEGAPCNGPAPLTVDDCKGYGWMRSGSPVFKNQGDCVSYAKALTKV